MIVSPQKKATKPKSKAKKSKKAVLTKDETLPELPSTPKKGSSKLPEEDTLHDLPSTPKNVASNARLPVEDTSTTPLGDVTSSGAVQLPPAFTPSIQKTLNREPENPPAALPEGLTPAILKARLTGKKVK